MTTARKLLLAFAAAYVLFIVGLFLSGAAIAAAILTLPGGWISIGYLAELPPQGSAVDVFLKSWIGNLVLLLIGLALNVAGFFLIAWGLPWALRPFGISDADSPDG